MASQRLRRPQHVELDGGAAPALAGRGGMAARDTVSTRAKKVPARVPRETHTPFARLLTTMLVFMGGVGLAPLVRYAGTFYQHTNGTTTVLVDASAAPAHPHAHILAHITSQMNSNLE